MHYRDFFTRAEDVSDFNVSLYKKKIVSSLHDQKAERLFEDCFSNHVDFNCQNIKILDYNLSSSTRYFTQDSLTSYFINKIYKIPDITNYKTKENIDVNLFINNFTETSFATPYLCENFILGSNRIMFLVGNVGEGKTAFMQKIISIVNDQRRELDPEYKLVTVNFNVIDHYQYGNVPEPLKDNFVYLLYNRINEELVINNIDMCETMGVDPKENSLLAIKYLINNLKKKKVRLLLFIDNLDFYHYYYARYSFFPNHYMQQEKMVDDNILWLISLFRAKEKLGLMGLNILIAARQYVYEDIVSRGDGTKTDIDKTEAIKISLPNEEIVLSTRFKLLGEAIEIINKQKPGTADLKDFLSMAENMFFGHNNKTDVNSPIKTIYKLGQHGFRSLVSFFSSLNVSFLDYELLDRIFTKKVKTLYILYFNNMKSKYTQKENHFPNLFLNDCTVMDYSPEFEDAHQPHMHTYWLKYFILKMIVNREKMKVKELLDIFYTLGQYKEHLVRHVIGSLCTANEFRCAEIDYNETGKNLLTYKLKATERGKMLFKEKKNIEFCFEFEYLEVVVDDQWLSYPNDWIKQIYLPKMEYSYLYEVGDPFLKESIASVYRKTISIMYFLKILDTSYKIEIEKNKKGLHSVFLQNNIVPNFEKINSHIERSSKNIIKFLDKTDANLKIDNIHKLRIDLQNDQSFEEFFNKYYESRVEVSQ